MHSLWRNDTLIFILKGSTESWLQVWPSCRDFPMEQFQDLECQLLICFLPSNASSSGLDLCRTVEEPGAAL